MPADPYSREPMTVKILETPTATEISIENVSTATHRVEIVPGTVPVEGEFDIGGGIKAHGVAISIRSA